LNGAKKKRQFKTFFPIQLAPKMWNNQPCQFAINVITLNGCHQNSSRLDVPSKITTCWYIIDRNKKMNYFCHQHIFKIMLFVGVPPLWTFTNLCVSQWTTSLVLSWPNTTPTKTFYQPNSKHVCVVEKHVIPTLPPFWYPIPIFQAHFEFFLSLSSLRQMPINSNDTIFALYVCSMQWNMGGAWNSLRCSKIVTRNCLPLILCRCSLDA
jgi:hypothetical protein